MPGVSEACLSVQKRYMSSRSASAHFARVFFCRSSQSRGKGWYASACCSMSKSSSVTSAISILLNACTLNQEAEYV